jgi:NADH-quinone oxidoreductase subunit J
MEKLFFILFAGVAVTGAVNVLWRRHPLHSALSLLVTMAALTGLYVLLQAQFIAVIQVLVYAGAILVLFLFVTMLLNVRAEETRLDRWPFLKWLALPVAALLVGEILYIVRLFKTNPTPSGDADVVGLTERVGRELFTTYLLPFEVTSVLILVAIIGAMVLAKRG